MKIESIRLENFKAFKSTNMVDIPKLCVIVGANGSGKTTLFDVFGFLKDCLIFNVRHAIQKRGGYDELVSRGSKNQELQIELKFRMSIAGIERLVTYHLEIANKNKRPFVKREILRYKRGPYGSPFHFLDFAQGEGYAITNEEVFNMPDEQLEREQQKLDSDDILAIKGLGQFQKFKAANTFRQLIENWHVSDFHINLARGSKDATGYEEHLSITGDNLQLVARNLFENHPKLFDHIIEIMRRRVPGITSIEPIITQDGRLLLGFQDGAFEDPFIDRYVSDGTIKMFAYLVLLYDPHPHPLLCIEEPENQLYPRLLEELAEEFRMYANKGGQVFVSTHSPDFLNAMKIDEVFWLVKEKGYANILRARNNEQIRAYMQDGDKMGYLWKQGFFEGVDPQ